MAIVKYYGFLRSKTKHGVDIIDVRNIRALLKSISENYDVPYKDLKRCVIYVDNIDIDKLDRLNTKLEKNSIVMILSASAGG